MEEPGELQPSMPYRDPIMQCCMCQSLLDEPQLLSCLHSCCLSCLQHDNQMSTTDELTSAVAKATCPICEEVSGETTSNSFVACRISRHKTIASSSTCGVCTDRGDASQPAEAWCASCRMSLCATCTLWHGSFHKAHKVVRIEEVSSWDEACPAPAPLCSIHRKPFDFVCFTCQAACRCADCLSSCTKRAHDVKHLSDAVAASYTEKARGRIADLQRKLLSKAQALSTRQQLEADLQCGLDGDLTKLRKVKLRLLTAIDCACISIEKRLRDTYGGLRAKAAAMSCAALTMERKVNQAASYSRCVAEASVAAELLNQEHNLTSRMATLSAELDKLRPPLGAGDCVAFDSPLPGDDARLADLVMSWIGSPRAMTNDLCTVAKNRGELLSKASVAAPHCQQPHPSGAGISSCVELPVNCRDVSLTEDGRLLLAAGAVGLLEYCTSGHELSRWRCCDDEDEVLAVEALSDGRAAVGVCWERIIVLLKRRSGSEAAVAGDRAWTEEMRIDRLQQPPYSLAALDGTIAVAMQNCAQVELMSGCSGELLSSTEREYIVQSVAITDLLIITASASEVKVREVKLTSRRQKYVVDAHSRSDGRLMWRHELPGGEEAIDVCTDAAGRTLYVAALMNDMSGGRVAAVNTEDGREQLHDVIVCSDGLLPYKLSLGGDGERTVLVALCYNTTTRQWGRVATICQFSSIGWDAKLAV